jgi:hypothetical protein
MRAVLCVLAVLCATQSATALELLDIIGPFMSQPYYVGGGAGVVHHTGYVPDTVIQAEKWEPGGKVVAGWRPLDRVAVEASVHHFGKTSFDERAAVLSIEQSYGIMGALLLYTPTLPAEFHLPRPLRLFGRFGGAVKFIDHDSAFGRFNESGVSYVIGFGLESEIARSVFFRLEYEYVSKIISDTGRAIDVQHTPITASLGVRF